VGQGGRLGSLIVKLLIDVLCKRRSPAFQRWWTLP
jgi:hypothetical protein